MAGHPNGGYLQCILANGALAAASENGATHQHVTAMSTTFIGALELGPFEVVTEVRRVGRGASFVHVVFEQAGEVKTESLVTLGNLVEGSSVRYQDATAPKVAPLEECQHPTFGDARNIMHVVDLRLDPSCIGFWTGETSPRGEILGWTRLDDGEASWSPWSVLFAGDALPRRPSPLGSSGWVPTLQLTSYVRRIPLSEWLRIRQWAVVVADGLVDERCEMFDDDGQLVSSTSQLAMVRFPEAG